MFVRVPRLWAEKRVEGGKLTNDECSHCPVIVCTRERGLGGGGLEVGQAFQLSAPKQEGTAFLGPL